MVEKDDTWAARKCFSFLIWTYRTGGTKYVYFDIISADVVYHLQKSCPYLLIFAPIKDFLDVYNVEQPGQI